MTADLIDTPSPKLTTPREAGPRGVARAEALMPAVVQSGYGGPERLALSELPIPTPGPGEVRVRVRASSVNFGDNALLAADPWPIRLVMGLRRPRHPVFGLDFAGEVAELGPGVDALAVGDRVFGETRGAHARYVVAKVGKLARVPDGVELQQAGAAPVAGVTALRAIEVGRVEAGHRVLIIGASGGVGHFAVQVARAKGAEVTAVCSGRNAELVRRLGATHVIDYTTDDYTAGPTRYDMILDLAASAPLKACLRLRTPTGVYLASVGVISRLLGAAVTGIVDRRVKVLGAEVTPDRLERLGALLASGAVRADIEKVWTLDQVGEAMAHQRTRRTRGKAAIAID